MANIQETNSALKRSYRLRIAVPGAKSVEVTFPYEVVEREARKYSLSVEQFLKEYHAIAHFNSFDGVYYTFEKRD